MCGVGLVCLLRVEWGYLVFKVSPPPVKTGDTESLDHQIVNISIYCVVFASISAVVGTFYPSPREVWDSGWGLLVSSVLGGDRIVYLGMRRGFLRSCFRLYL